MKIQELRVECCLDFYLVPLEYMRTFSFSSHSDFLYESKARHFFFIFPEDGNVGWGKGVGVCVRDGKEEWGMTKRGPREPTNRTHLIFSSLSLS
jgi:hypothetical protein